MNARTPPKGASCLWRNTQGTDAVGGCARPSPRIKNGNLKKGDFDDDSDRP